MEPKVEADVLHSCNLAHVQICLIDKYIKDLKIYDWYICIGFMIDIWWLLLQHFHLWHHNPVLSIKRGKKEQQQNKKKVQIVYISTKLWELLYRREYKNIDNFNLSHKVNHFAAKKANIQSSIWATVTELGGIWVGVHSIFTHVFCCCWCTY